MNENLELKPDGKVRIEINGFEINVLITEENQKFRKADIIKYAIQEKIISEDDREKDFDVTYYDKEDKERPLSKEESIILYDGMKFNVKIKSEETIEIKVNDRPKEIPISQKKISYEEILEIAIEYGFRKPKDGELSPEIYYRGKDNSLVYIDETESVTIQDGMEFSVEYGDDS